MVVRVVTRAAADEVEEEAEVEALQDAAITEVTAEDAVVVAREEREGDTEVVEGERGDSMMIVEKTGGMTDLEAEGETV